MRGSPGAQANEFWQRVDELIREFTQLPRTGDTVYGFVAGLYPTDHPTPPRDRTGGVTTQVSGLRRAMPSRLVSSMADS